MAFIRRLFDGTLDAPNFFYRFLQGAYAGFSIFDVQVQLNEGKFVSMAILPGPGIR